jgi:hypothetical protein
MRTFISIAVLCLSLAGCRAKDDFPAWPPFSMMIPDDVPDQMTVTEKNGEIIHVDGKKCYTAGYRDGWRRCVYDYEHYGFGFTSEKPDVPLLGHWWIVVRGWDDGYTHCWQAIRETKHQP